MKKLIYTTFLLMFVLVQLNAQVDKCTIKGKIIDNNGEPLIGASILVKGTTQGTITNFNGNYTLKIFYKDKITLVITYTGFSSRSIEGIQVSTDSTTVINALLEEGIALDEVVIVAPSIHHERNISYCHSTVSSQEIRSRPRRARRKNKSNVTSSSQYHAEAIDRESYSNIEENIFKNPLNDALSTFSIDVDAASYSNVRRIINNGSTPPNGAVRIEEMINYFDYDYPQPSDDKPFEIITEYSECPWQKEHQLLHIGLQGRLIDPKDAPPSNLVFLLDVSGSMGSANKLPLVKESMKLLIGQLRAEDKVSIVVYAGASGLVLPPTPGDQKATIIAALDKLRSGGSTAGGAGIELAYKYAVQNFIQSGNNRVILATDGDFNVGISSNSGLVKFIEEKRKTGIFLTVLGFGMDNYQDDKMQQLANKGNGSHAYIDNLEEAKKVLVNEMSGTLYTIAKDVKLQLEFNPPKVARYRLIGYENRLLNDEDFEDDTKDAGELGTGHTVTALYEIIPKGANSPFIKKKETLIYQKSKTNRKAKKSDELVHIKFRYKHPEGMDSTLIEKVVSDDVIALSASTDAFRWSATVAEFGMLLTDSEFKGASNWEYLSILAQEATGKGKNGYRDEMIESIKKAKSNVNTKSN